jgi:putative redox protein
MYQVTITHKDDQRFVVSSKDYEFMIDTKGGGVTPPDALLASLGSCLGVYIRKYAESARLELNGFTMYVKAELTKEPPVRFASIDTVVDFKGAPLDERRKQSLMEFIRKCPVHNTIEGSPRVDVTFL